MADLEKKVWGIHTKDDSLFLKQGKMAIGWREMGDLTLISPDRDSFKQKYMQEYPDAKKGAIFSNSIGHGKRQWSFLTHCRFFFFKLLKTSEDS